VNRTGAALVLALLVLLVLEGVVLGTVYLTVQERRIADNGITALRLRLAAESAARAAAATWPAALDSLAPNALSRENVTTDDGGLRVRSRYQRVDSALVLVFAEAAEPPPRAGRARAALLIQPPLLPETRLPEAALSAGATVKLRGGALLTSAALPACADDSLGAPDALRLPAPELLERDAGAAVVGPTRIAPLAPEWAGLIAAIAAQLDPLRADSVSDAAVIAIDGDLTVAANSAFRGIILVTGSVTIEAGAVIDGIVLSAGPIEVNGTIRFSPCAARQAIRAAGLHRPRAYPLRSAVPAF
jgi:hypothetical protein